MDKSGPTEFLEPYRIQDDGFNSLEFFFFAVVVGFGLLILRSRPRIIFLVLASYAFYGVYRVDLCLLLMTSSLLDWFVGRRLFNSERRYSRVLWLLVSLIVNLGLLAVFKCGSFALDNLTARGESRLGVLS